MSDNNEAEFESMLAELTPAKPSAALEERIEQNVTEIETSRKVIALPWSTLSAWASAAAAIIAVVLVINHNPVEEPLAHEVVEASPSFEIEQEYLSPVVGSVDEFKPVDRFQKVLHAEQSPVFITDEGIPARSVYLRYLDTVILENETSGASLSISSPREEIRVVPAVAD